MNFLNGMSYKTENYNILMEKILKKFLMITLDISNVLIWLENAHQSVIYSSLENEEKTI